MDQASYVLEFWKEYAIANKIVGAEDEAITAKLLTELTEILGPDVAMPVFAWKYNVAMALNRYIVDIRELYKKDDTKESE